MVREWCQRLVRGEETGDAARFPSPLLAQGLFELLA
jgi:hypothetical protein